MKNFSFQSKTIALALIVFLSYACSNDDDTFVPRTNNAEFTFVVDDADPFTVHFSNESQDYNASYWRFGDGSDFSTEDAPSHTFPSGGKFEVVLAVGGNGNGGEIRKTVEIIDPALQGERLKDGNFEDEGAWNIGEAGYDILTDVVFTSEGIKISNEGGGVDTNVTIWQEIEVEAGKEYFFTADVAGGGMDQAWVEFHFSNEMPDGDDYSANNLWSLNTWAECGVNPFEGNIVELSCSGNGESNGIFSFDEGGTAYFVIKAGSWQGDLGPEGVIISNVSLMPVEDIE